MTKRERARLIKLLEKISDAFEEYTDNLEDDGDFWEALGKAEDFQTLSLSSVRQGKRGSRCLKIG